MTMDREPLEILAGDGLTGAEIDDVHRLSLSATERLRDDLARYDGLAKSHLIGD